MTLPRARRCGTARRYSISVVAGIANGDGVATASRVVHIRERAASGYVAAINSAQARESLAQS